MQRTDLPDFDTLLAMHREDPEALERVRAELTDELFRNAPEDLRRCLEGLQFRITMELRRAGSQQARFLKLSSMMHDSVCELNDCLHNPLAAVAKTRSRQATILKLEVPRDRSRDH